MDDTTLMTRTEAAEALRVTPPIVTRYIRAGLLPGAFALPGSDAKPRWRIPRSAVQALAEQAAKRQPKRR